MERLDADVLSSEGLDGLFVGAVAVRDNSGRSPGQRKHLSKQRKCLGRGSVSREMETKNKTRFGIDDEPEIVFHTIDFDNSLVSMPLIGIEIQSRYEFQRDVVKEWSEAGTPVSDSGVRDRDIVKDAHDEGDLAKRVIADKKHDDCSNDDVNRIAHT